MRDDFGIARGVIMVLEIIGWLMVVVGLILAMQAYSVRSGSIVAAMTMLGISVAGLLSVASAQITRAVVITAENSGQMVALLERIAKGGSMVPSPGSAPSAPGRMSGQSSGTPAPVSGSGIGSGVKRY